MKNIEYWIWFTQAIGYCTPAAKQLTQIYDSIKDFYYGGESEWILSGLFNNNEIEKLGKTPLSVSDEIIRKCSHYCYEMITIEDSLYPKCLYSIDDPPAVLYVSGFMPDIDERMSVGIVGTRRASVYGMNAAYDFAKNLAKHGVTIISGGARGIDTSSHVGALAADGVTICVLGCGINYDYLRENERIRRDITFKGAVISEYPPDTEPFPFHFPQRNRIISALSDGILVIEAGKKSGSLITVECGLEQDINKKIFALAGSIDSRFDGTNKLIKDRIAELVTDYKDILDAYDNIYATSEISSDSVPYDDYVEVVPVKGKAPIDVYGIRSKDITEAPVHKENLNLTKEQSDIYYAIGNKPVYIDEISEITKLPVNEILPVLTVLELKKLIKSVQGRGYVLV